MSNRTELTVDSIAPKIYGLISVPVSLWVVFTQCCMLILNLYTKRTGEIIHMENQQKLKTLGAKIGKKKKKA